MAAPTVPSNRHWQEGPSAVGEPIHAAERSEGPFHDGGGQVVPW